MESPDNSRGDAQAGVAPDQSRHVALVLGRHGLARGLRSARAERNGVPLLSSRRGAAPVTPELVNQLRDELA